MKQRLVAEPQAVATRKASEIALEVVTEAAPELVLGSADLTPSNNTKTKNLAVISPGSYSRKRYIHYGIREHSMAAAMNGLARRLPSRRRDLPRLHRLRPPGHPHRRARRDPGDLRDPA